MIAWTDMDTAPRNRNILVKTKTMGYWNSEWNRGVPSHLRKREGWHETGFKWVEARWCEAKDGRPAEFREWCGNARTQTTGSLYPVAWAELPTEDA